MDCCSRSNLYCDPGYLTVQFMNQKSRHAGLMTLIGCCLLTSACLSNDQNQPTQTPVVSSPPSTSLPMPPLNGRSINNLGWETSDGRHTIFSDLKGNIVILDFYATWCDPCRQSVPHLIELQRKYESSGLKVIGLNVGGPGDPEKVDDFARELGIQYSLAIPDDDLVGFLMGDRDDIPQTFVFDRQGQLVERFIGFGPATGRRIDYAVESALNISNP